MCTMFIDQAHTTPVRQIMLTEECVISIGSDDVRLGFREGVQSSRIGFGLLHEGI